jgi:glycyl-tRNA synthetase beta chain
VNHATRAGLLSKCDLMTNMVFEFTDTQGVMGMHYARHDGEAEDGGCPERAVSAALCG